MPRPPADLPPLPQMELRYGEVERARQIYERYVKCLPSGAPPCPARRVPPLPLPARGRAACCTAAQPLTHTHTRASPPTPPPRAVKAWVRYAKFEMREGGDVAAARACYERAVEELGDDANNVRAGWRWCRAWCGVVWWVGGGRAEGSAQRGRLRHRRRRHPHSRPNPGRLSPLTPPTPVPACAGGALHAVCRV